MKRRSFIQPIGYSSLAASVVCATPTYAAPEKNLVEKSHRFADGRDWFFEKRFGLFELEHAPQDHISQKPYLRLINLQTNKRCNTVLVIKLEFGRPPKEYVQTVTVLSPDKIQDKQN